MRFRPIHFLADERGAVTLDWVVLTAVLVGTGLLVVGTLGEGIGYTTTETAATLEGYAIRSSFGPTMCSGGIEAVQAAEDSRIASGGVDSILVSEYMSDFANDLDDAELKAEHARLQGVNGAGGGGDWSRDSTVQAAVECEMVLRGLD